MPTLKKIISEALGRNQRQNQPDTALLVIVAVIIIFGLVMLSSASLIIAYTAYHDAYFFFKTQIVFLAIGVFCFFVSSQIDYRIWSGKMALIMLVGSIGLLLLVFIPGLGKTVNGSRSWIELFGVTMQPAEFVKLSFLLYLSAWLAKKQERSLDGKEKKRTTQFFVLLGVIAVLMLLQPDLGTLFIISLSSLAVYFVSRAGHMRQIVTIAVILFIVVFGLLQIDKSKIPSTRINHQLDRFRCLVNPDYDRKGACYQINQSLLAIGSGGILGRGVGESRQKFMYIPEVQNDFIFSIIGEEVGFIFSGLLVILFVLLFYRGYLIAKHSPDDFGRLLALGIVTWITGQAILNIGGIINLLPMTGVPLPFVSAGGSAIVSILIAIGILVNISKYSKV